MSSEIVEIDGSIGEGGGQILRIALSLSCILRRPIRIVKIRAGRPNPGLSNQHLYGLNLLQKITNAKVNGNVINSTEVEFHPKEILSERYEVDTRTAASITLILQAVVPVLLFGHKISELKLIGGTNVGMAPQVDFMSEIFRPNLELFGATFDFDLIKRGYYPRGGGQCEVTVPPIKNLKSVQIVDFKEVTQIEGWSFVAGRLPMHIALEMKRTAMAELEYSNVPKQLIQIEEYKEAQSVARENGFGIVLKAQTSGGCTIGCSALGDKRSSADGLGTTAGRELRELIEMEICVDRYVQDQVILYMALASGTSRIHTCPLTNHTRTAIAITELMTGVKFHIENVAKNCVVVSCKGIGVVNKNL